MKTPVKTFVSYLSEEGEEVQEQPSLDDLIGEMDMEIGNTITVTTLKNQTFCWKVVRMRPIYTEFETTVNELQLQLVCTFH